MEDLLDLQSVDLEIDRLLDQRASLPELDQYKAAHAALEAIAIELEEARGADREVGLAVDKSDGELTLISEKRDAEERRLYAGGLNARETGALMSEVEMLGKQVTEMEEMTFKLLDERDAHQKVVAALEQRQQQAKADEDRLEAVIAESWKAIDADVAVQEDKKKSIASRIDPELMEIYEELRPIKDGVAVGRLGEGICGGCHLRLSEAEQIEVAKTDPPRCVHCRRLLVLQ
ncbi:MAG: hypothetical protein OER77_16730 [Myxococcales bacterium]|nr:hypothetical protein [Myxococcales bacterium]